MTVLESEQIFLSTLPDNGSKALKASSNENCIHGHTYPLNHLAAKVKALKVQDIPSSKTNPQTYTSSKEQKYAEATTSVQYEIFGTI